MHAISSYRGNRPTNKQTHAARPPQTGPITIHCVTKLSAQFSKENATNPNQFLYARVEDLVDSGSRRQADVLADVRTVEERQVNDSGDVGCRQDQHVGMSAQRQRHNNIFVFIRQVATVPACWLFKTSATVSPFDLESGIQVTCYVVLALA